MIFIFILYSDTRQPPLPICTQHLLEKCNWLCSLKFCYQKHFFSLHRIDKILLSIDTGGKRYSQAFKGNKLFYVFLILIESSTNKSI